MKKIDIAFVVHKKEDPNSRLRIYPVAYEMRKRGWRCEVRDVPKSFMGRVRLFLQLTRTDVILLHKKLFNPLEVRLLKALRKRIIFDFDDAIMYTEARRKQPMTDKFTGRFRKIMEISEVAVAGNEFLANEAKKHCRRVEIMTTPVDVKLYTPAAPENKRNEVVIGWIGLPGNLFYLDALAPVFQNLARKFPDIALSVVCSDFPDIEGVKINKRIWNIESELEFLREMDIGLMPLTDDICAGASAAAGFRRNTNAPASRNRWARLGSSCSPVDLRARRSHGHGSGSGLSATSPIETNDCPGSHCQADSTPFCSRDRPAQSQGDTRRQVAFDGSGRDVVHGALYQRSPSSDLWRRSGAGWPGRIAVRCAFA